MIQSIQKQEYCCHTWISLKEARMHWRVDSNGSSVLLRTSFRIDNKSIMIWLLSKCPYLASPSNTTWIKDELFGSFRIWKYTKRTSWRISFWNALYTSTSGPSDSSMILSLHHHLIESRLQFTLTLLLLLATNSKFIWFC